MKHNPIFDDVAQIDAVLDGEEMRYARVRELFCKALACRQLLKGDSAYVEIHVGRKQWDRLTKVSPAWKDETWFPGFYGTWYLVDEDNCFRMVRKGTFDKKHKSD